jgi:hypothetical protein
MVASSNKRFLKDDDDSPILLKGRGKPKINVEDVISEGDSEFKTNSSL